MKRRVCLFCGKRTGADDALELVMRGTRGEVITLRWHMVDHPSGAGPCAALDPLHDPMADALSLPDGPEGDRAAMDAYKALRDRAAERGVDHLRDAIEVTRDFPAGRWTLKGDGDRWGLLTERRVRGRNRSNRR